MKFYWDQQEIAKLGKVFLQQVVSNAGNGEKTTVQFGIMGEGCAPNYQVNRVLDIWGVEKKDILIFNGLSHSVWSKKDKLFKQSNLSDPFLLVDIKDILNTL